MVFFSLLPALTGAILWRLGSVYAHPSRLRSVSNPHVSTASPGPPTMQQDRQHKTRRSLSPRRAPQSGPQHRRAGHLGEVRTPLPTVQVWRTKRNLVMSRKGEDGLQGHEQGSKQRASVQTMRPATARRDAAPPRDLTSYTMCYIERPHFWRRYCSRKRRPLLGAVSAVSLALPGAVIGTRAFLSSASCRRNHQIKPGRAEGGIAGNRI